MPPRDTSIRTAPAAAPPAQPFDEAFEVGFRTACDCLEARIDELKPVYGSTRSAAARSLLEDLDAHLAAVRRNVPPGPAAKTRTGTRPPAQPFDEAFEDALLGLMTLRLRAMGESPVAWPALNSACRSLAALWLVTHTGDVLMLRARDAQGAEDAFLRAMAERIH
jgi:hypothetical protein